MGMGGMGKAHCSELKEWVVWVFPKPPKPIITFHSASLLHLQRLRHECPLRKESNRNLRVTLPRIKQKARWLDQVFKVWRSNRAKFWWIESLSSCSNPRRNSFLMTGFVEFRFRWFVFCANMQVKIGHRFSVFGVVLPYFQGIVSPKGLNTSKTFQKSLIHWNYVLGTFSFKV